MNFPCRICNKSLSKITAQEKFKIDLLFRRSVFCRNKYVHTSVTESVKIEFQFVLKCLLVKGLLKKEDLYEIEIYLGNL